MVECVAWYLQQLCEIEECYLGEFQSGKNSFSHRHCLVKVIDFIERTHSLTWNILTNTNNKIIANNCLGIICQIVFKAFTDIKSFYHEDNTVGCFYFPHFTAEKNEAAELGSNSATTWTQSVNSRAHTSN